MDSEYEVLKAYVQAKQTSNEEEEEEQQQQLDSQQQDEGETQECSHADQVVYKGEYVCCSCGLTMDAVYLPEVDAHKRCCMMKKPYATAERMYGLDRHLLCFLAKCNLLSDEIHLHPVREHIQFLKKSCSYKSLNYAIALSCILYDDDVTCLRKLRPFLPRSIVAWLRFSRLVQPLPERFPLLFVLHLMEFPKKMTSAKITSLRSNLLLLSRFDLSTMHSLIDAYCWESFSLKHLLGNLDTLHPDLISIMYRFSKVAVSHPSYGLPKN